MAAPKGNKYSKGRPVGAKNKKTERWEALVKYAEEEGASRFGEEIKTLRGREYAEVYLKLLEYCKPKLARTEVTGKDGEEFKGVTVYLPEPKHD